MGRVCERKDIAETAASLRKQGKRIVFTNGCFDIIHAGHVRYLRQAKALGDFLIVGVNSDRSVGGLKKGRPIVSEAERAEVLSSLDMVDCVVIFDEQTPWELINTIHPDVLVKGGDWKREDIVGSDIVREVHSLPYHEGLSTSNIVERVLRSAEENR